MQRSQQGFTMTQIAAIHYLAQQLWDNGIHDSAVKEILRLSTPVIKPIPENSLTLAILRKQLFPFIQAHPTSLPYRDKHKPTTQTDGREGILANHSWYHNGRYYFKLIVLTRFLQKLGINTQRYEVSRMLGELPRGGGRSQLNIERSGVTVAYFHEDDM